LEKGCAIACGMARKLRVPYEGAIDHVTVRGNGRRTIFADDQDRDRLLWRMCQSKETYGVRVYV
jgi:putative transposase